MQNCNKRSYEKNIKSFLGFKVAKILLLEREEEVSAPSRPDKKVGSESCSASAGSAQWVPGPPPAPPGRPAISQFCRLKFLQTERRRPPDWPSVASRRLPATLYGCLNGWGSWGERGGHPANNFLPAPPAAQPTQEKQEICFKWDGKTWSTMREAEEFSWRGNQRWETSP